METLLIIAFLIITNVITVKYLCFYKARYKEGVAAFKDLAKSYRSLRNNSESIKEKSIHIIDN